MGVGVGGSVYPLTITVPSPEGSVRLQCPLPKCQELVPLGRVGPELVLAHKLTGRC